MNIFNLFEMRFALLARSKMLYDTLCRAERRYVIECLLFVTSSQLTKVHLINFVTYFKIYRILPLSELDLSDMIGYFFYRFLTPPFCDRVLFSRVCSTSVYCQHIPIKCLFLTLKRHHLSSDMSLFWGVGFKCILSTFNLSKI